MCLCNNANGEKIANRQSSIVNCCDGVLNFRQELFRGQAVDLGGVYDRVEGGDGATGAGHVVLVEDNGRFRPSSQQIFNRHFRQIIRL